MYTNPKDEWLDVGHCGWITLLQWLKTTICASETTKSWHTVVSRLLWLILGILNGSRASGIRDSGWQNLEPLLPLVLDFCLQERLIWLRNDNAVQVYGMAIHICMHLEISRHWTLCRRTISSEILLYLFFFMLARLSHWYSQICSFFLWSKLQNPFKNCLHRSRNKNILECNFHSFIHISCSFAVCF